MADSVMDPIFGRLALVLNRALQYDDKTRRGLAALGTCSIAFKLRGADSALIVNVLDGELSLTGGSGDNVDVRIDGGFVDFLAMVRTQRNGTPLSSGKVEIQGDLASAQQVQTLIAQASFDWEELLARQAGSRPARQISRFLRTSIKWAGDTGTELERDVRDYLVYELGLLPTEAEVEHLERDGATVSAGVDRLQQRIARIRRKRKNQ
ncbi:MAG: SCP2 sterol-binding domain-containing protein [Gammaproteobacteria bacterium]|nr:SCP2 sterol-binding domain-containing protein [Gammaproteobacteria bacterium]